MSQFIISYIGGEQPASKEEGMQQMTKYKTWLASLGKSAVSPANPFKNTHTVSPGGTVEEGGVTSMSGYTIVSVDTYDEALSMAKACPFLEMGGSLEVSELMSLTE